ncbi:MAG TPA: ATP-binding cassette domain-containing protein [Candidatus Sulfotelmatobacter sp.]|nr:ATP-binding cassette domain-containing protein [Candidatus Sulfotelmatobacter sp.]
MNDNANEIIGVRDLECRYGDEMILQGVTFAVKHGEIFCIAGRSGCGKTTLLKNMVGLEHPSRGQITYFGRNFTGADSEERQELVKSFGMLFQNSALWTDMSLSENIALPLLLHTRLPAEIRAEIVALKLAQVGLAGQQDRSPVELSGGMQKRAALARALALDPAILFFDEPTAGLDPITAAQIDELILKVREIAGATMVIVSHSLPSIFHIADRMILLDAKARGILAEGTPEELAADTGPPQAREFLRPPLAGWIPGAHYKGKV